MFYLDDVVSSVHFFLQECFAQSDRSFCPDLVDTLNWFFFELFIFNYVEDIQTGLSFHLPLDQSLSVFVEVSAFFILFHFDYEIKINTSLSEFLLH